MISLHYVGLIRKNNVSARASLIHAPCWMWKRSRKRKRGKGEVYYLSPPPPLPSIYSCLSYPWLIRLIFRLRDTFTTGLCLVGFRQTGKKSFFHFNLHAVTAQELESSDYRFPPTVNHHAVWLFRFLNTDHMLFSRESPFCCMIYTYRCTFKAFVP